MQVLPYTTCHAAYVKGFVGLSLAFPGFPGLSRTFPGETTPFGSLDGVSVLDCGAEVVYDCYS